MNNRRMTNDHAHYTIFISWVGLELTSTDRPALAFRATSLFVGGVLVTNSIIDPYNKYLLVQLHSGTYGDDRRCCFYRHQLVQDTRCTVIIEPSNSARAVEKD